MATKFQFRLLSSFSWRSAVNPNDQLVTSHRSLYSTNLPSTTTRTWQNSLNETSHSSSPRRGGQKDLYYKGSGDLSPAHRLGARLIVKKMLTRGEIEILWQFFLRRVDIETIFLNRCSIESSNMSLAEFEEDWRILATFFGSISWFAWPIDWWSAFSTFSLF